MNLRLALAMVLAMDFDVDNVFSQETAIHAHIHIQPPLISKTSLGEPS